MTHVVLDEQFAILASFSRLDACRAHVVELLISGRRPEALLVMTYDEQENAVATYDEDDFALWRERAFDVLLA